MDQLLEEKVKILEKRGEINFTLRQEGKNVLMHTYLVTDWEGEPIETEEMKPQWFNVNQIPYEKMWPDDIFWLPMFLENKKFNGKFVFDDQDNILEKELSQVNEI